MVFYKIKRLLEIKEVDTMRAKAILSLAFGMSLIPALVRPQEVQAFMMGGGSNNACDIFVKTDIPANYGVTLETDEGDKETVPFMVKFNENCPKVREMPHAVYHINNGTNLFFLKEYGDMVVYSPAYQGYEKLQKTSNPGALYDNYQSDEGESYNRFGSLFVNYSVPRNDTSCGFKASNNNPVCIKNSTYYEWGHSLANYNDSNLDKLTKAIQNGDQATINALTGEFEYIGYSTDGTPINNAYFPNEYPVRYSNGKIVKSGQGGSGKSNAYPWINNPWAWGTSKTEYDDGTHPGKTTIKRKAIRRLIKQENLGKTVDYWMNRLSLKNNATAQAGIFEGRENGPTFTKKVNGKKQYLKLYNLVILESTNGPGTSLSNVAIMEMNLYDGDEKVATFTRRAIGYEQADVWVKQVNGKPMVFEGGKEYTLKVKVVNGSGKTISTSHQVDGTVKASEDEKAEITQSKGSTSMANNASQELTLKFKMPEANGKVNIDLGLNEKTYARVNSNRVDDRGTISVQVETPRGDISVCDIKLFEKGGATEIGEEDIVQDREYDVKYYICYEGDDIKGTHKVDVTGTLATTGQYHQEISLDRTIEIELNKTNVITETIQVSNPEIITNIKISTENNKINTDTTNDSMNAEFKNAPNIKLNNLTITPGKIEFTPVGCHVVTVSYNLTLEDVKSNYDATFNTTTRIVIGNKTYEVTDRIKKGTHKYTHNLEYCFPNGDEGGTREVIAEANKNQAMFESTISDNVDSIDWNGNNNGLDRIGCPVGDNVKNEVTWTQTYTIDTVEVWYENGRLMQKVIESENKTVSNQIESFKITSIQMRSKLQQDLEMGEDGWIDVIRVTNNTAEQIAIPKIKAGYGFEFRIQAEYTTNAFDNVNQQIDIPTLESGEKQTIQVVSAGSHDRPNLVNDFYLNIDGKTTLNVGNGLNLDIEKSGTNESTNKFNVTITPHTSPNTGEADDTRVYIGENTADGEYKMTFYTPAITGLTSKSESENTILCDDIEIKFNVTGSVYDDLNTHEAK